MIDMKAVLEIDEKERALNIRARIIRAIGSNKLMADHWPDDPWWQGYAAACEDAQGAAVQLDLEPS